MDDIRLNYYILIVHTSKSVNVTFEIYIDGRKIMNDYNNEAKFLTEEKLHEDLR